MMHALVAGERDPHRLAELALGKLQVKQPALNGRFGEHVLSGISGADHPGRHRVPARPAGRPITRTRTVEDKTRPGDRLSDHLPTRSPRPTRRTDTGPTVMATLRTPPSVGAASTGETNIARANRRADRRSNDLMQT